jgi:hypothetical protein
MEVLQLKDYEKMAEDVVSDFIEKEAALNDSILKIAQDRDMNPEQIKRLVELSNTKAFLKMFKDNSEEKKDEFDVADPREILRRFYSGDSQPRSIKITKVTISKIPGDELELDFPDMMRATREGVKETAPVPSEEKSASFTTTEAPYRNKKDIMKLRKVAEELMNRVYDSEHTYNDKLDKVASDFCALYGPDYKDFEKEAILRYGKEDRYVKHALEDIRSCIKWSEPMYCPDNKAFIHKVASEPTEQIVVLNDMCNLKRIQVKYAEGIKVVNRKLESLLRNEEN